jgi:hypothetical protein
MLNLHRTTPMNKIASILGESLIATVVIILCLSLPSLLGLPLWTLPFFGVPAMLYLDWRLGERLWARWKIVRWVVGMSLIMFLWTRFAPTDYGWWVVLLLLIIFPPSSWLFWRKTKREDSYHAS